MQCLWAGKICFSDHHTTLIIYPSPFLSLPLFHPCLITRAVHVLCPSHLQSAKAYVSELFGLGVRYVEYLNTTLVDSVAPCYAPWAATVGTTSLICTGIVGSLVSDPAAHDPLKAWYSV